MNDNPEIRRLMATASAKDRDMPWWQGMGLILLFLVGGVVGMIVMAWLITLPLPIIP